MFIKDEYEMSLIDEYINKNNIDISVFNPEKLDEIRQTGLKMLNDHCRSQNDDDYITRIDSVKTNYPVYYSPGMMYALMENLAAYKYSSKNQCYDIIVGDLFKLFDEECQKDILKFCDISIERTTHKPYLTETFSEYDEGFCLNPEFEMNTSEKNCDYLLIDDYKIYCHCVTALYRGVRNYMTRLNYMYEMCDRMGIEHDTKMYKKLKNQLYNLYEIVFKDKEMNPYDD